jgi:hypothetical protein
MRRLNSGFRPKASWRAVPASEEDEEYDRWRCGAPAKPWAFSKTPSTVSDDLFDELLGTILDIHAHL